MAVRGHPPLCWEGQSLQPMDLGRCVPGWLPPPGPPWWWRWWQQRHALCPRVPARERVSDSVPPPPPIPPPDDFTAQDLLCMEPSGGFGPTPSSWWPWTHSRHLGPRLRVAGGVGGYKPELPPHPPPTWLPKIQVGTGLPPTFPRHPPSFLRAKKADTGVLAKGVGAGRG